MDMDYNHPSVIMYSIGNEVSERYQERGVALAKKMTEYIHSLDKSRAVTGGINLMIIYLASKGKGIYKEVSDEEKEKKAKQQAKVSGSEFFNVMASMIGSKMNSMAYSDAADKLTIPVLDTLDIVGENKTVECNDDKKLTITIDGGELLGFGNASPRNAEQYDTGTHTTYFGRAQAVVRRKTAGTVIVKVSGEGLNGETRITVTE